MVDKEDKYGETRVLRKRNSDVDYRDQHHLLDEVLGADEGTGGRNKHSSIKSIKPDIASHRRKLERTCPASAFSAFVKPADVEPRLVAEGFRKPLVVRADAAGNEAATRDALGIDLPLSVLSPRGMVKAVGGDIEVPTFDVSTQDSGPRMTVKQLADYFTTPADERSKLINVVSFSLADTDLADKIQIPAATRCLDLASRVWPDDEEPRPETLLYALLGPKGAYTDWHVDMGGSSVWYHLLSGCKIFVLAPNTPKNIKAFQEWSVSEHQTTTFLGDKLSGCQRVVLRAGDTLFLPSGWPHAVSTPEDSFVLGGNFLHSLDYESIANVYRVEKHLGVQPKFQFPLFKKLMWYSALDAVEKAQHAQQSDDEDCNESKINVWVQRGLPHLLQLLREWQSEPSAARRVDVPSEIRDPAEFLEELDRLVNDSIIVDEDEDDDADPAGLVQWRVRRKRSTKYRKGRAGISLAFLELDYEATKKAVAGEGGSRKRRLSNGTGKGSASAVEIPASEEIEILSSEEDEQDEDECLNDDIEHRRVSERRSKQLAMLQQLREARAAKLKNGGNSTSDAREQKKRPAEVINLDDTDEEGKKKTAEKEAPPVKKRKFRISKKKAERYKELILRGEEMRKANILLSKAQESYRTYNLAKSRPSASEVSTAPTPVAPRDAAIASLGLTAQPPKRKSDAKHISKHVLGVTPLGRSGAPIIPNCANSSKLSAPTGTSSPVDERSLALKELAALKKLEAELRREEKLLETATSGGMALKDSGMKIQAKVESRRAEFVAKCNTLEGKVFHVSDSSGQKQGPFTSQQLAELVHYGHFSGDCVVEQKMCPKSGGFKVLRMQEAIAVPEPLSAILLREKREQEEAAAIVSKVDTTWNARKFEKMQAEKVEGGKSKHAQHSRDPRRPQQKKDRPPQQRFNPPAAASTPGPSAWEIAAVASAAITVQESAAVWTFKSPCTGQLEGPYSTADLRVMYRKGELVDDVMVHDEEAGVSQSLFSLLGVAKHGGSVAGLAAMALPPRPAAMQVHEIPIMQHHGDAAMQQHSVKVVEEEAPVPPPQLHVDAPEAQVARVQTKPCTVDAEHIHHDHHYKNGCAPSYHAPAPAAPPMPQQQQQQQLLVAGSDPFSSWAQSQRNEFPIQSYTVHEPQEPSSAGAPPPAGAAALSQGGAYSSGGAYYPPPAATNGPLLARHYPSQHEAPQYSHSGYSHGPGPLPVPCNGPPPGAHPQWGPSPPSNDDAGGYYASHGEGTSSQPPLGSSGRGWDQQQGYQQGMRPPPPFNTNSTNSYRPPSRQDPCYQQQHHPQPHYAPGPVLPHQGYYQGSPPDAQFLGPPPSVQQRSYEPMQPPPSHAPRPMMRALGPPPSSAAPDQYYNPHHSSGYKSISDTGSDGISLVPMRPAGVVKGGQHQQHGHRHRRGGGHGQPQHRHQGKKQHKNIRKFKGHGGNHHNRR